MTLSYGEIAAEQISDQHAAIVMAALDGDLAALKLLVKVAAQSGYTTGYGAAASVMGVTL